MNDLKEHWKMIKETDNILDIITLAMEFAIQLIILLIENIVPISIWIIISPIFLPIVLLVLLFAKIAKSYDEYMNKES